MNITFIGKYPPISGGEATKLYWLAKNLGERGHKCTIVSDCQERTDKSHLSLEDLTYLQPKNIQLFSTVKTDIWESEKSFKMERISDLAIRTIGNEDSDIIVGWYLIPYGVSASLASKYSKKPFVLQHAGSDMKRLFSSSNLKSLLMNQFSSANGIMSYPSYYSSFKSLNNNVFLHNPKVDMSGFDRCPDFEKPSELEGKRLITFLGKISESKGAFDLLKAYDLMGESEEFALIYLGGGKKTKELKKSIQNRKLKNVYVYPSIPPWRVPGILRKSDVFFVGERDFYIQRHFSRKAMEAMSCKSPLLISSEVKNKGIYKNLIDRIHCIEVDPLNTRDLSDKLKLVLDNINLSSKISENGYEFARKVNEGFNDYISDVEIFLRKCSRMDMKF